MNTTKHYRAIVARIRTHVGRASHYICPLCSHGASDWLWCGPGTAPFTAENGQPYSEGEDEYVPLCRPCGKTVTRNRPKSLEERQRAAERLLQDIQRRRLPAEHAAVIADNAARVREAYRLYRNGAVREWQPREVTVAQLLGL